MTDFIRYGKFDTLDHAKNGLSGTPENIEKIAKARLALYNARQKAKEMIKKDTKHG